MLQKHPKPAYRRYIRSGAKVVFVVEAVIFAITYGAWYRMNTSRDFRLYMHHNYNWALNSYYKIGETISSESTKTRDLDLSAWKREGKLPTED